MDKYNYYVTPQEYEEANKNGVSNKLLENRIRRYGWTKRRAITTKPRKKNSIKEWRELALSNGICEGTFNTRIRQLKWDYEKAATTLVKDRRENMLDINNKFRKKYPKEIYDLRKKNGISYKTYTYRVEKMKMNYIEAATMPIMSKEKALEIARKEFKRKYSISS